MHATYVGMSQESCKHEIARESLSALHMVYRVEQWRSLIEKKKKRMWVLEMRK
jgi:hypothetical protein